MTKESVNYLITGANGTGRTIIGSFAATPEGAKARLEKETIAAEHPLSLWRLEGTLTPTVTTEWTPAL